MTEEELRKAFEFLPMAVFVVDRSGVILDCNEAAEMSLDLSKEEINNHQKGEAFHCLHFHKHNGNCERNPECRGCKLREAIQDAFNGMQVIRSYTRMELQGVTGEVRNTDILISTCELSQGKVLLIVEDVGNLFALRDVIPICGYCRAVRNENGDWQKVESFFHEGMSLKFSHGVCPNCLPKLHEDMHSSQKK